MSKFRSSTFFWAPSIRRETILLSMASPSCMPSRVSTAETHSPANLRIRSSSSDRKNRDEPGSPCRPARPRSWLSMRRLSCRSVPMMCRPPSAGDLAPLGLHLGLVLLDGLLPRPPGGTSSRVGYMSRPSSSVERFRSAQAMNSGLPPRMMSVPRPAMLVAIVTAALAAGLRDDLGLALVVLGVEHLVRDAVPLQQLGELLRLLDRGRAHQDRPARLVDIPDLVEDRADTSRARCGRSTSG